MAVFASAVLDNFNRANGAIGANWSQINAVPGFVMVVSGNTMHAGNTSGQMYYNPATYGSNCEIFITALGWDTVNTSASWSFLYSPTPTLFLTPPADSYAASFSMGAGASTTATVVITRRYASGAANLSVSNTFPGFTAGMKTGLQIADYGTGTIVSAWIYNGTFWTRVCAMSDPVPITSGYFGFTFGGGASTAAGLFIWDDWSGGNITPTAYSITSDWANFGGIRSDVLASPVKAPHHGFHEGNVAGVLPDPLCDDVSQRASHSGWVDKSGGGVAGVAGV